jgi:cell division protein WhiA
MAVAPPRGPDGDRAPGTRHHLAVRLDRDAIGSWSRRDAPTCDHRSFVRGALLGSASISFAASGVHIEFVLGDLVDADELLAVLEAHDVRARRTTRRGQAVVYIKGQEATAALLRLVGANRSLLELEAERVGRDVRSRLNRLVNAEEANLGRTVRAADRQLAAIASLERSGRLHGLGAGLRETAALRRRMPDADLDTLGAALGVSRSAVNHRLRRLVELAREEED